MPDSLQRVLAVVAGILTAPLVAVLALAVKLDSSGPAIYAASRVGEGGRTFRCFKLRTMRWAPAAPGASVTGVADPRITGFGRLLRRLRLDELPQLWNVARGEMRLVGPRPEDPRYVDFDEPLHREVFTARPGIAGLTQLFYADEAARLQGHDPDRTYREELLPAKLHIDAAYLRHRSTALDLWILAQTPLAMLGRPFALPTVLRAELRDGGGHDRRARSVNVRPTTEPRDGAELPEADGRA